MKHLLFLASCVCLIGATAAAVPPAEYFSADINAPYVSWLTSRGEANFEHSAFLSGTTEGDGVAVHWTIDDSTRTIRLAVAAPATGWVGFGLAEAGGMKGADIVLFEAATNTLTDAYAIEYVAPKTDDSQDWLLIHSQTDGNIIIFEAERLLDTGDAMDRPIGFDGEFVIPPHRVIAAWGDTPTVSYHGDNRARSALRFYPAHGNSGREEDVFAEEMAQEAEGYIDLLMPDHPVSLDETEYVDLCFSYQDLINLGMPADVPLHIIGFEPVIDSARHLHHLVMFGSGYDGDLPEGSCDQTAVAFQGGLSLAWGYAPGGVPWEMPDEAGVPLGPGEDSYKMFYLNYHYDNRWQDTGISDSSGVRIYYTTQKRKHDAGILQLGDPIVQLAGEPIGQGLIRNDFNCPSTCSLNFKEEVTVYKEVLHMHEVGVTMFNEVIRDGEVMRRASVDYFDFDQAGLHEVQQGTFTIKPGDSIRTSCSFNTTSSKEAIEYGYGSQDEMCVSYMHYYPKQKLPLGVCGANWFFPACAATLTTEPISEVERVFGVIPPVPGVGDTGEAGASDDGTSSSAPRSAQVGALALAVVALSFSFTADGTIV